jgi:vitamin B12 transporter
MTSLKPGRGAPCARSPQPFRSTEPGTARLSASVLAGAASLLAAGLAHAQARPPLDAVIVTASRLPARLDLTPDAYVVSRDRIEGRQATFAADVLAQVPGVSISQAGSFGGVSSLRLRGAASDKTLVLIDGAPVNDPSAPSGGFDFSGLDLADVERIEILTGPQGALWGSDAIGGVVALTSRELDGVRAFAEGGSLTTLRGGAALGRAADPYAFGLSVSSFRTAGVSKADARDGNSERDGFNTTTVSGNLRANLLGDRVILDARGRFNTAATEYDGFGGPTGVIDSNDSSESRIASGYVRARIKDLLGFDQELRIDLLDLDRQYHGAFPFGAKGGQQIYRWSAQREAPQWALAFGVEHRAAWENAGDGRDSGGGDGAYAVGRWTPRRPLTLTASVRRDNPQRYPGQTTGRLAAAYQADAGFTLKASVGQGYKAPSIFETAYPCLECAKAGRNRALRPERADGWDGGLAWTSPDGALRAEATYFSLRIHDQIDYLYPTGYRNIQSVRSAGVEGGGEARLPYGLRLNASYTHDEAVDGTTGARLLRVPRDTGSGALGWQGHGFIGELGVRAQTAAPDVYGAVKPFAIGYAAASYAFSRTLTLTAHIENLANAHYQQAFGYGEPGRTILLGVRWRAGA